MKKSLWKQIRKIESDYKEYSLEKLETLSKNDSNSMYALALRYCKNDDMKKGEEQKKKALAFSFLFFTFLLELSQIKE